jgi:CRP-like cAMP-binding protein
MDQNLLLAAQKIALAPSLQHSESTNGLRVVKNAATKTYLTVTQPQWRILEMFAVTRSVPMVLAQTLDERACLPLGEFYELVLKAIRARILIVPGEAVSNEPVYGWRLGVRSKLVIGPLLVLFCTGIVLGFAFQPSLPSSALDVFAGLAVVSAALSLGSIVAACIVRGGGGEVYPLPWHWWRLPPHFAVNTQDMIMLPAVTQRATALATPAILATAAGIMAWQFPAWSFIPLLALAFSLRPILGGRFAEQIRFNHRTPFSDAEQAFIFPPNHRPKKRWEMFQRAVRNPDTWARLAYGVAWTLAIIYLASRLTDTPPWTMAFWKINGLRVALAVGGSLITLAAAYLGWELYYLAREHFHTRRSFVRQWYHRWFGAQKQSLFEEHRVEAVSNSAFFRLLPPPERQQIARMMKVTRHRAWRALPAYGPRPVQTALIFSGRIGLYRKTASGHLRRVQTLSEGDIVGLHDLADPKHPEYFVRSLTPVTLFGLDRADVAAIAVSRISPATLCSTVLKLPFLRQIALCQNWHFQAVERFAALANIVEYSAGSVIFSENQFNQEFYVLCENGAVVSHNGRKVGVIHAGDFFGEIGLLQNSSSTAQVSVSQDTRCLSIDRTEFMRFVTHNYTVALELERVGCQRLGYPIFPLKRGNFRSI